MRLSVVFATILSIAVMAACGGGTTVTNNPMSASSPNNPGVPATPGNPGAPPSGSTSSSGSGTWQRVSLPSAVTHLNHIAFSSGGHWFIADRTQGFYRSTDQGASWTRINTGLATTFGFTIDVNRATGVLIASTYPGVNLTSPIRFYRSTDEGSHWTAITTSFGLSAFPAPSGCAFASNGNVVCGGFWSPAPYSGVWVSSNGGLTTVAGLTAPAIGGAFSFALNPVTKNLWLGNETQGVFRSTDNGFSWTRESPPDQAVDPVHGIRDGNAISFTFDRYGNVLFASQGGIWKSSNSGTSYTWRNVMPNRNTSAGKSLGRDGSGNLYYGHNFDTTNPTTIYRSIDNGATWTAYDSGVPHFLEAAQFLVDPADRKMYVYVEDEATGVGTLYRTASPVQ